MENETDEVNKTEKVKLIHRSENDFNEFLWDLKLIKFPEESPNEFGINLLINPIQFMYHPKAINQLMVFFKADYDQILKDQVVEKWADMK